MLNNKTGQETLCVNKAESLENGKVFSSQGKVREFGTDWKGQGISVKCSLLFLVIFK